MAPGRTRRPSSAHPGEVAAKRPARGSDTTAAAVTKVTASKGPGRAKAKAAPKSAVKKARSKAPARKRGAKAPASPPAASPPFGGDNASNNGYVSADYSDKQPEPRHPALSQDILSKPDDFFGSLKGVLDEDAQDLEDAVDWALHQNGEPTKWQALPLLERVRGYQRRLRERQMEGTETALDPAYYRWDHPNLFAAEDHCGDTRKCMKMIDKAITEWVGLAFGSTIAWDSIRFVDKDWLMAWAPKARVWIETEKEYGFKALMSAWVWRILWEQLFSAEAPADKWNGEHWIAFSKFQQVWDDGNDFPFNPDLPLWYRSTKLANARILYAKYGFHTSGTRLKAKILDPFCHLNAAHPQPQEIAERAEMLLNQVCYRAARLDLILISSPLVMNMSWCCPLTKWQHSFPFVDAYSGRSRPLMQARIRDHTNDQFFPDSLRDRTIDFITRPLLRIRGTVTQAHDSEGPLLVRDIYTSSYEPKLEPSLQVMIDNDEETVRREGRKEGDTRGQEKPEQVGDKEKEGREEGEREEGEEAEKEQTDEEEKRMRIQELQEWKAKRQMMKEQKRQKRQSKPKSDSDPDR